MRWLALVVATFAVAQASASGAPTRAPRAGCHGTSALVHGARTCLRTGLACRTEYRGDYLLAGFDCVRRGWHRKLARASAAALRHGEPYVLGTNGLPSFDVALQAFN